MKNCLNCGTQVLGNYCPECGQSAATGKLKWKNILDDLIHTFTHADKSLLGTTRHMILRPGVVLQEYIDGKRKKYQSPISYFIIWVTLSILCHRMIIHKIGFHPVYLEGLTFSSQESTKIFINHGQWLNILSFPLMGLLLYLILSKGLYSYIESLAITSYTMSTTYMFFAVFYLVWGGLLSFNVLHWKFYLFQIIFTNFFIFWVLIKLFYKKQIPHFYSRIAIFLFVNCNLILQFLEFLCELWIKIEHTFNNS